MCPQIHIILPTYAVIAFLGLFIAVIFIFFRIEKFDLKFTEFLKLFAVCLLFGFIGSRLVFFLSRVPWLINNFSLYNILNNLVGGGFVFYGGLFGVLYGCKFFSKKNNLNIQKIYSMIVPAIPLFHSIGRIGCLMGGCCYGAKLGTSINIFNVVIFNRIPTQIIESIFEAILFIAIFLSERKINKDYLKIYLISYAIFRFILEFFRGDNIRGLVYGVSTSQFISIGILLFYILKSLKSKYAILKARQE